MSDFTHINENGAAAMVNVSSKNMTKRKAVAQAKVILPENVLDALLNDELHMPKGPVFQTAIIAGIMAAKRTGDLIPLCHPIGLDHIEIHIRMQGNEAVVLGSAEVTAKTGVEMEALTAVSVAALTIYDMCKALSHDIVIREICLIEKTGGKNDFKRNA